MSVFGCPHRHESRGLKSGDRAGQLTVPPRPIHKISKVLLGAVSQRAEDMVVLHHARTSRVDADEKAGLSNETRRDFAPKLLVRLVRHSVLRADTRCPHSPKRPAVRYVQYIPLWYIILDTDTYTRIYRVFRDLRTLLQEVIS